MKAVVVYESLWGNTAAAAGAPVLGFRLSADTMRESIGRDYVRKSPAPDLSHPSLRSWLDALPAGSGRSAAFDTQVKGPFGKGAPAIADALESRGYARLAEPKGFVVKGRQGPLRDGERERARACGERERARVGRGARAPYGLRHEEGVELTPHHGLSEERRRGRDQSAADCLRNVAALTSR